MIRKLVPSFLALLFVVLSSNSLSIAQESPPAAVAEPAPSKASRAERRAARAAEQKHITRADLAASYLRLERAYFSRRPQGERVAEINRAFDQATLAFFSGDNASAIRRIDELTHSLGEQPATLGERAAMSLKVTVTPPVWRLGGELNATARIVSLYEPTLDEVTTIPLKLWLVSLQGRPTIEHSFEVKLGPGSKADINVPLKVPSDQLLPGVYEIALVPAEGAAITAGRVNVIDGQPLDELKLANEKRLESISTSTPALAEALATCRARNGLLSDSPSEANSAQFLTNMAELSREVHAEIDSLATGKDPYYRRGGDYWRVVQTEGDPLPVRIYAPEAVTKDKPSGLLIVLHGAGGDENMFLQAYGDGIIKQIADETGLLIASPLTYKFGDPKSFDRLLQALAYDYAIDLDRVYILGHSMGAGTVAGLAKSRADQIAAACCLAGGRGFQNNAAPILAVVAELDGVIPAKGIQTAADKAISAGAAVEVRVLPGLGHTLVVGTALPDAVQWLLKHSRPAQGAK